MKTSIVIPTFNPDFDKLLATLESIGPKLCDTLVVENGSRIAEGLVRQYCDYQYLETPSANKARNHGWMVSKADYILFTDDDIIFSEDYFYHLDKLLEHKPTLIGGKVVLKNKPAWLTGALSKILAEVKWDEWLPGSSIDVCNLSRERGHWLVSANMCVKREFLENNHGFDEEFGYKADNMIPNDENHVLDCAKHFLYSPKIKVTHNIEDRYTEEYLLKRFAGQGIADALYNRRLSKDDQDYLFSFIPHHFSNVFNMEEIYSTRAKLKNEKLTQKFIGIYIKCRIKYLETYAKTVGLLS
jgi:glycosyltransferase involved in cell wall biosynthesis